MNIPFRYGFVLPKHFSIDAAAILNFNTYASAESFYDIDDEASYETKHVKTSYKDLHLQIITVDFMVRLQWRKMGLYAKYSPCKVLNTDFGPSFTPFSTGLVVGF